MKTKTLKLQYREKQPPSRYFELAEETLDCLADCYGMRLDDRDNALHYVAHMMQSAHEEFRDRERKE